MRYKTHYLHDEDYLLLIFIKNKYIGIDLYKNNPALFKILNLCDNIFIDSHFASDINLYSEYMMYLIEDKKEERLYLTIQGTPAPITETFFNGIDLGYAYEHDIIFKYAVMDNMITNKSYDPTEQIKTFNIRMRDIIEIKVNRTFNPGPVPIYNYQIDMNAFRIKLLNEFLNLQKGDEHFNFKDHIFFIDISEFYDILKKGLKKETYH